MRDLPTDGIPTRGARGPRGAGDAGRARRVSAMGVGGVHRARRNAAHRDTADRNVRPTPSLAMPHRSLPALLLVLAAAGCASDGATPPDLRTLRDGAAQRVEIARFGPGSGPLTHTSGVRESARLVVRDDALWRATWAAIWSPFRPEPDLPPVDFAREMVAVAALGERSSGGHAIVVDSASLDGATLVVHVRTVTSGPRCYVTAALTQPVDAVRLPRHDGAVRFSERAEVFRCD